MHPPIRLHIQRRLRAFVLCCLFVALPVFGVTGTLVELLGASHVHRVAATGSFEAEAALMRGWSDLRRATPTVEAHAAHTHSHAAFARHHHDRDDTTVVALDAHAVGGEASDDGGASDGHFPHVPALTDAAGLVVAAPPGSEWSVAVDAAAPPWATGGPLRPPKG